MVSNSPVFWSVFLLQFAFWLVLSFTKVGRVISALWGSIALMSFIAMYTIGPYGINQAWNIGYSGNTTLMVKFITKYFTDFVDFLIQLVLPPWAGFFLGSSVSLSQNDTGGI